MSDLPTKPQRLNILTLPLLVALIFHAGQLLTLPFFGKEGLRDSWDIVQASMIKAGSPALPPLTSEQLSVTLWIAFGIISVIILWINATRQAVIDGKKWGRVSAIVFGIFCLLSFPIGTPVGALILLGAFNRDVVKHASK